MKELSIPLLTEQDIDCRVQSVSKAKTGRVGAVLLLYKDARVDMRILDQVFGPGNWQRTHEVALNVNTAQISAKSFERSLSITVPNSLTVPEWKSPVAAKATGQRYTIVTPIRHTKEDQTKM